jgi:hypothetical protein
MELRGRGNPGAKAGSQQPALAGSDSNGVLEEALNIGLEEAPFITSLPAC